MIKNGIFTGLQIGSGRDTNYRTYYEERRFKFTTFLSYEALNPCLSLFAVMGWFN
jgi:hypothetical protein